MSSKTRPDHKLLAALHQLNPNPVIGVDLSGHVTFLSDGATRVLESLGKDTPPEVFLPKDLDDVLAALMRREQTALTREVTVGDRVFEESIHVTPEHDAVGIYATDITERKRAEREVLGQTALLKALVESPPDIIIFALDRRYRYTAFNTNHVKEMRRVYGVDIRVGMSILDVINLPEVRAAAQRSIDRALAGRSFTEVEVQPNLGIWYSFNWSPIHGPDGKVDGVTAFISDITRRKQVENALAESELKYRRVFETSNDAMMLLDPEQFFDCNEAALKVFGYSTRDEFLGRHPAEVSPPHQTDGRDSRVAADDNIAAAFRAGRNYFEWLHRRADGTVFPADVMLTPMEYHGRKILQATVRDISDRKQAEAALAESEERYRRLVSDIGEGIGIGDADERFLFANRAAEELLGVPRGGLIGRSLLEFLSPEQAPLVRAQTARRRTGERSSYELGIRRPDGTKRTALVTASPRYDAGGGFAGSFGIFRDITERRQAEQQARAERDKLRRILDAMPDSVYVVGQDDELQYVNPALLARSGPVNGRKCHEYFHRRTEPCPNCVNPQVFAGGTTRQEYTTRQGVTYDIQDVPVTGDDGRPARLAFMRDVTAGKRAEEALRNSERKFKHLFDESPSGIALVDAEGVVLEANPRLLNLLGVRREDLVGMSFRQLLPEFGLDLNKQDADFRRRLANQPAAREITFDRRDGKQTVIEVQSSIVGNPGEASGVMYLVTDITDRKQAEAELEKHREHLEVLVRERTAELEAANRELEAFSYSVSHDLRAPLRAIDGFAQALLDDCGPQLDAVARGHLNEVSAAACQMAELIDDLLSLAHVARMPLERKPVNLSELARTTAGELREAEPARRVEFMIQDGVTAPADPVLAGIVLRNLMGNAWKFTSRHAAARIEFGETRGDGERVWFVRDDGAGFDMAYVNQLFKPFQRLHTEHDFPGSGIGLAIVHRIVLRHGGRVWIEAEVEKGATCRFTLEPVSKEA